MTVELEGKGKNKRILLSGRPCTKAGLEMVCKQFFSDHAWENLWRDLETCGCVHIAFVFVNQARRQKEQLDLANN